jgi:hypothetical protein
LLFMDTAFWRKIFSLYGHYIYGCVPFKDTTFWQKMFALYRQ